MSASQEIVRSALLFVVSTALYLCAFKPIDKSMDIADVIEKKNDLGKFINEHFDSVVYEEPFGPFPGNRVHLINKTDSFKFCTMNVQQCWVKKTRYLICFFYSY